MDLKEVEILADQLENHWYYKSKALAVLKLLGTKSFSEVLDVGAGSGYFSKQLLKSTSIEKAVCVDTSYTGDSHEQLDTKSIYYTQGVETSSANLVLLMDVLEHVDDDAGLLEDYVGKVAEGTTFVITVPAFRFMWSGHDEFLEHKRRYTLGMLQKVVIESGLQIEELSYYFAFVFPGAFIQRVLSKSSKEPRSRMRTYGRRINAVLFAICKAEALLFQRNKLFGLSVVSLARKP